MGAFLFPLPPFRTLQLATLTLSLLLAMALPKPAKGQARRVFTAEELQQAGVARLSDLYRLLDGWYAVSTNDYVWNVAVRGLAATRRSNLMLLLNGRPVDLSLLGKAPLGLLPVHAQQLDSVVVTSTPIFAAGLFASGGTIHLYTRPVPPGFSVRGGFAAGNEIGDPGPYLQTDRATVNIDRYGPVYFAAAVYGAPSWYARLSYKGTRHYVTDTRLRRRIQRYYAWPPGRPPLYVLRAPRLALGTDGALGRHRLTVSHTSLRAFPFFAFVGYELPAQRRRTHVSLHGNVLASAPQNVRYRFAFTRAGFGYAANKDTLALDWGQNRLRLSVEYQTRRFAGVQAALGLGIDRYRSRTGYALSSDVLRTARLYGRLRLTPAARWTQRLTGVLTRTNGRLGFKALATSGFNLPGAQRATLTFSYARRPFAATNSRWYWMRRGWHFARTVGGDVTLPSAFSTERTFTADVHWTARVHPALRLTLRGGFRTFGGRNLVTRTFDYERKNDGLSAHVGVHDGVSGRVWTGAATVRILLPALTQRVHVGYLHPVSADPVFRRVWRSQPRLQFSYRVGYTPVARFSLRARLAYRAATTWPAYRAASVQSSGRYPMRLPAFWLLDVTASKDLWGDHLDAFVTLHNVLNEPLRVHPAGTVTRLMLRFGFTFLLN